MFMSDATSLARYSLVTLLIINYAIRNIMCFAGFVLSNSEKFDLILCVNRIYLTWPHVDRERLL